MLDPETGAWAIYRADDGTLADDWLNGAVGLPDGSALVGSYDAGVDRWHAGRLAHLGVLGSLWVNPGGLQRDPEGGGTFVSTAEPIVTHPLPPARLPRRDRGCRRMGRCRIA